MIHRRVILILLAIALSSCSSTSSKPAASTPPPAATPVPAQSSSYMQGPAHGVIRPVPPLEADRKINEQDCTQGIDLKAGNLRCI